MDSSKVVEARKYRIYPDTEQQETIKFYIECNRLMWNEMLARIYEPIVNSLKEKYDKKYSTKILYNELKHMEYKDKKQLVKPLNKIYPKQIYTEVTKLKNADVALYGYTKKMLRQAFSSHFMNPKHFGMPRFKGFQQTIYQGSYTTNAGDHCYFKNKDTFKISKVGNVLIKNHYPSQGRMFRTTISRKSDNTYFVTLGYEQDIHTKIFSKTNKKVGIDFNVDTDTALAFSNESFVKRPKVSKLLSKLDWETKKLGKKRERLKVDWSYYIEQHKDNPISFSEFLLGCANYQKNRMKVAKLQHRIRNIYDYWIKSTASKIVKNDDVIAVEDLKPSNMIKNHKLARAIAQSHFRELRTSLEYKANWSNKKLVAVDPKYTTQTCSNCGYVLNKTERLTLADRKWTCPQCHIHHVRDTNAAKNILKKGILSLENN